MQEQQHLPLPKQGQQNHLGPEHEAKINNQHLQVGIVLMPKLQWGSLFTSLERKRKEPKPTELWKNLITQGNVETISVKMPLDQVTFFMTLLCSAIALPGLKSFCSLVLLLFQKITLVMSPCMYLKHVQLITPIPLPPSLSLKTLMQKEPMEGARGQRKARK